jgi:hypothetical protein
LDPRERDIVVQRRMKDEPAALKELSRCYGLTCERIRQIELRAVEKLRRLMLDSADDPGPHKTPDGTPGNHVRSTEGRIAMDAKLWAA